MSSNSTKKFLQEIKTKGLKLPTIQVPDRQIVWSVRDQGAAGLTLVAELENEVLNLDMQQDAGSWATFLLCLAYWLDPTSSNPRVFCEGIIKGPWKDQNGEVKMHRWRSACRSIR
jgi:hypothetical protein